MVRAPAVVVLTTTGCRIGPHRFRYGITRLYFFIYLLFFLCYSLRAPPKTVFIAANKPLGLQQRTPFCIPFETTL